MSVQVPWHLRITGILAAMHDMGQAGKGESADFWLLKALAQLIDLRICGGDSEIFEDLSGEAVLAISACMRPCVAWPGRVFPCLPRLMQE